MSTPKQTHSTVDPQKRRFFIKASQPFSRAWMVIARQLIALVVFVGAIWYLVDIYDDTFPAVELGESASEQPTIPSFKIINKSQFFKLRLEYVGCDLDQSERSRALPPGVLMSGGGMIMPEGATDTTVFNPVIEPRGSTNYPCNPLIMTGGVQTVPTIKMHVSMTYYVETGIHDFKRFGSSQIFTCYTDATKKPRCQEGTVMGFDPLPQGFGPPK